MKEPYSPAYTPPAPVLSISVAAPDTPARLEVIQALIDTGSDGTFIPRQFVSPLKTPPIDQVAVRSAFGGRHTAPVYLVDLIVGELRIPNVRVIVDERMDEAIIGRDVLNRLFLTLDGPENTTEVLEKSVSHKRGRKKS